MMSDAIGRLLRNAFPIIDDHAGQAALLARIRDETKPTTHPFRVIGSSFWKPVLAIALALGLVLAVRPPATVAGFRIGRFVSYVTNHGGTSESAESQLPGTKIEGVDTPAAGSQTLSFRAAQPSSLPGGLSLSEQSIPRPDTLELLYRTASGLVIRVSETPSTGSRATMPSWQTIPITVQGVETLVQQDPTGSVSRAMWERDGILFGILVLQTPDEGFSVSDAINVVGAFISN
jgi:hypothetical protein